MAILDQLLSFPNLHIPKAFPTDHPAVLLILLLPPFLTISILLITYCYTSLRYRFSKSAKSSSPPLLPYTIPWLGHSLSFLAPYPGRFFELLRPTQSSSSIEGGKQLSSWYNLPKHVQTCTLLLAGRRMHITWDPVLVQALFKNRSLERKASNVQVLHNGLGMPMSEVKKFYLELQEGRKGEAFRDGVNGYISEEGIYQKYLLDKAAVNELTRKFIQVFRRRLDDDDDDNDTAAEADDGWKTVNFYSWLRPLMFAASTTSFMGERIAQIGDGVGGGKDRFAADFFSFDTEFMSLFFGIPRWINPRGPKVRERLLRSFEKWEQEFIDAENSDDPVCQSEDWWEPRFGSRFLRERQKMYRSRSLCARSRSSLDLGFLFGLNSNAIPATGWMISHLLADPDLQARILAEIKTSLTPDGEVDVGVLVNLPLLNATLHETLRCYTDVLVSREITQSLTLPSSSHHQSSSSTTAESKSSSSSSSTTTLESNSMIICPSWMGHRDPDLWTCPPVQTFSPSRFLNPTGTTFSTAGTAGKFFPFGGGRSICPGRVFARQEVLGAVALVLLRFQFDLVGYVDGEGKSRTEFPGLRKAFAGTGIMGMDGDVRVKIRRR